jgi:hypothetical protein
MGCRVQAAIYLARHRRPILSSALFHLVAGSVRQNRGGPDEKAAEGLEPVAIPARRQPEVEYGVAVVESSRDKAAAEEFVAGLIEGEGQEDLREAGFRPPP